MLYKNNNNNKKKKKKKKKKNMVDFSTVYRGNTSSDKLQLTDALMRLPLILLVSYLIGNSFNKRFNVPQITTYISIGILSSSSFLRVLSTTIAREQLWLVDNMCLSCIGVAAGAELSARDLRGDARKIFVWTILIAACTWFTVFAAFSVGRASEFVQFLSGSDMVQVCAIGSLIATLSIARSPASAIAVLRETESRGPFSKLVVSITVLKDVFVVVLFALNMEMIESLGLMDGYNNNYQEKNVLMSNNSAAAVATTMTTNETLRRMLRRDVLAEESASFEVPNDANAFASGLPIALSTNDHVEYEMKSIIHALEPIVSVFGSFVFGFFAGAPLHSVLRRLPATFQPSVIGGTQAGEKDMLIAKPMRFRVIKQLMKPMFTVCYSTFIFVVSKRLFLLEPLLVCVCCGIFCANRGHFSPLDSQASSVETTTQTLEMPSVPSSPTQANSNKTQHQQQLINALGSKALHNSLIVIQPMVNLVFFTLAGVALETEHVIKSIWAAIVIVLARILGIFIASKVAARVLKTSETSDTEKRVAWMAHVTQAGVALGLARTCSVKFSNTWGEQFASVATAVIALNLLIGPPLFRFALHRVGESKTAQQQQSEQNNNNDRKIESARTSDNDSNRIF